VRMPETPPLEQEQEEETPKSRLTQAWWFEQDLWGGALSLLLSRPASARWAERGDGKHGERQNAQFAKLSDDGESVAMAPIRKNMTMSTATTQALAATVAVVPCLKAERWREWT
jgi:hypothetical protein